MTRQELIKKANHIRKLPIRCIGFNKDGAMYEYWDIEYYFNSNDEEIGHYSNICDLVTVFEIPRKWGYAAKNDMHLFKLHKEDKIVNINKSEDISLDPSIEVISLDPDLEDNLK